MFFSQTSSDRLLSIYLALGQYPILSGRIRSRMRAEMFKRGFLQPQKFEAEVRDKSIESQEIEGLRDPFGEEAAEVWEVRQARVRDHLTDLYFSQYLSFEMFEQIIKEVLSERGVNMQEMLLSINPELAPQEMVFEQALTIERLPPEERSRLEARLRESKVVLIRLMISDQLRYINIAKEWFTLEDLAEIRRRKIGSGRIGGKAAGMLLAERILKEISAPELRDCLRTPESYFIGSGELYTFMSINNLVHWNDQKYKSEEEMRAEYPLIVRDFEKGVCPPDIHERLQAMLLSVGRKPMIVRSSSLLEDNFGTAFAGKYDSIFLPNQGNIKQNLAALTNAIARIYASTLNPNALLYRRSKGLQDYDERMGLLIQVVQGGQFGHYYLPHAAGVAFSRNLYRWAPQIRREDGFVRLVWGLGTRAVDRVGNDYPRLIALSHPLLRPSTNPEMIRRYSQQFVDVIDLDTNQLKTLPVQDVLGAGYPPLRYLAQVEEEGYYSSLRSSIVEDKSRLVLTFEELLRRTPFAERMREILRLLERTYRAPVDLEFTLHLTQLETGKPEMQICLLQCRPQSRLLETEQVFIPSHLDREEMIFDTHFVVPQGQLERVEYVLFVPPEGYYALQSANDRNQLVRAIGRLNAALEGHRFVCVGPGRWGSSNSDLGVSIDYGDIYHSRALVELAGRGIGLGAEPEPSLGTHFFQDLLESQIYPLAICLDDPQSYFNRAFFYDTPSCLSEWIEASEMVHSSLRLIRVGDYRRGHSLCIVMNDEKGQALAYLTRDSHIY